MTLNPSKGQLKKYENVEFTSVYHHTKIQPNQFLKARIHANVIFFFFLLLFLTQSIKEQLFYLFFNILLKYNTGKLSLNCSYIISSFTLISWKVCEKFKKWNQQVLLCAELATRSQGQGQWKANKIAEANGAYKHGWKETRWLKTCLLVMSKVKVFATQDWRTDGQRSADRTNTTFYRDPYVTHTDQKLVVMPMLHSRPLPRRIAYLQ